ncbi:MAG: hypothetical protein QNK37_15980 [Acidobacteriota bacterium]|nr:hypothetical protein [Acidobacteriota bacterium]
MSDKNTIDKLTKLAVKGMIAGAFAASASLTAAPGPDPLSLYTPNPAWTQDNYSETHTCAGQNICKGLGGCAVDAAKLKKLAKKAGIPLEKAGEPHDCAGKNACKGLGGCHVDAAKFAKLKAAVEANAKYKEVHTCAGLNICKGLGGCAVDAAKLKKLAKAAGVPLEKAGKPHACAGKNECKGLGGCHVDAAKFAKLKAKLKKEKK